MPHKTAVLQQVSALHANSIDQGFLASLGDRFLTLLYRAIDDCPDSILIVETRDDQVIGFVTGSCGMGPVYRELLRHWPSLFRALAPLMLQPRRVLGIAEILFHSRNQARTNDHPECELMSIAVSAEARGSGVGKRLYAALVDHFTQKGVSAFRIVVGDSLTSAHDFYLSMGATSVGATQVHKGKTSTIYVQRVPSLSKPGTRQQI